MVEITLGLILPGATALAYSHLIKPTSQDEEAEASDLQSIELDHRAQALAYVGRGDPIRATNATAQLAIPRARARP